MGNSKIGFTIVAIGLLLLSVWGVSSILTIQDLELQITIVLVIVTLAGLLIIKPSVPVDLKFILILMFGYFIAGKGFAYISPAPPVYIGEIGMILVGFGFMLRNGLNINSLIKQSFLINFILICLALAAGRVALDFQLYRLLAVRDSAMVYYSFFAVAGFCIFKKEESVELFKKLFPWALCIGAIIGTGRVAISSGLKFLSPSLAVYFSPHPDSLIPIAVALSLLGAFLLVREKKIYGALMFGIGLSLIFGGKTAFAFCFLLSVGLLTVYGKMRFMIGFGVAGIVIASIVLGIDALLGGGMLEKLNETDLAGTVDSVGSERRTTTNWRTTWWTVIARDVWNESPLMGLGFGSDITSNFISEYYHKALYELDTTNNARYPHNMFFSVLGRLGVIGVTLFLIYVAVFVRFVCKYTKVFIADAKRIDYTDVAILVFVFAGFCNSFVQSTYEVPYAAIIHWVCVGYMVQRYTVYKNDKKNKISLVADNIVVDELKE